MTIPLLAALLIAQQPAPPVKAETVIQKAVDALWKAQTPDGYWGLDMPPAGLFHRDGVTGLVVYTLLVCDAKLTDPRIEKGIAYLLKGQPWNSKSPVYETSLQAMAVAEILRKMPDDGQTVDGRRVEALRKHLQQCVDKLLGWQQEAGWNYGRPEERPDNSNTQFAVLGLRAAHNAGIKIPALAWEKAVTHFKAGQEKDGRWAYQSAYNEKNPGFPSDTMTAACLMGLIMTLASMQEYPDPREIAEDPGVKKGFEALEKAWPERSDLNPYLLWSIERACMLGGKRKLGDRDWHAEGTALLARQQKADGTWETSYGIADWCFAVLFLKKNFIPVFTQGPREQSK